jgi:hypothetical protein
MDRGIQTVEDQNNAGRYLEAYVDLFKWKGGLAISDYRYVVRICNIDVSNLLTASDGTDTSANLLKFMSMAIDLLPDDMSDGVRPVFLMTRQALSMLRVKMLDKGNLNLGLSDVFGESIPRHMKPLSFQGIPCLRSDAIGVAEAQITTATT